jgi:hypothetical protein
MKKTTRYVGKKKRPCKLNPTAHTGNAIKQSKWFWRIIQSVESV